MEVHSPGHLQRGNNSTCTFFLLSFNFCLLSSRRGMLSPRQSHTIIYVTIYYYDIYSRLSSLYCRSKSSLCIRSGKGLVKLDLSAIKLNNWFVNTKLNELRTIKNHAFQDNCLLKKTQLIHRNNTLHERFDSIHQILQ